MACFGEAWFLWDSLFGSYQFCWGYLGRLEPYHPGYDSFKLQSLRNELWHYLRSLGQVIQSPWLIAGDFNQPVHPEDKSGGHPVSSHQTQLLWDALEGCQLLDMGFSGPKFTWSNNRIGRTRIRERIDRAFCNAGWQNRFQHHGVRHLPRLSSDHHPILIAPPQAVRPASTLSPFRMLEMWYRHPTFEPLLQHIWCRDDQHLQEIFSSMTV